MTMQERLERARAQDNGLAIILDDVPVSKVQDINIHCLAAKKNHTFKVRKEQDDYKALVESIKDIGVKEPLLVRHSNLVGHYEIIAGHRRCEAAKDAGLDKVPCIVLNLSDTEADRLMAESNIQRPDWLPSEKARTYKVWLAAVQETTGIKAGRPLKNSPPGEANLRSDDLAARKMFCDGNTLRRYIKLNDLIFDLLELVDYNHDNPKCGIQVKAGYQLAFLSEMQQNVVLSVLSDYPEYCLKEKDAKAIRQEASNTNNQLSALDVEDVLGFRMNSTPTEEKPKKTNLSLPCDFGAKFKRHKNDPALIERLSRVISEHLEEVEE